MAASIFTFWSHKQMPAAATAAEKMNAIYRRQRFIYDATRRYYLFGRDRLIGSLKPPLGGSVLEIGCGTARNLIRAAKRYPDVRLYGLDVSEAMLKSARASVARRDLTARIALGCGDATAFQPAELFGRDSFDRVFVSYALSMIPPWQDALRHSAAQLAPGGELHIVDFGDFERYPALLRHAQLAWLRRFSVVPIPGMKAEIAALAEEMGLTAMAYELYGGYAIHIRLRHR
jgi:S-adenosylmethionine-diacylgycerolhomoserine-N-methlytransferase